MDDIDQKIDGAMKDKTRYHRKSRSVFTPPTIQEIDDYCIGKGIDIKPDYIWDFYESKGWMIGKTSMKNWRSAVSRARYWEGAPKRKLPASTESVEKQKENIRQEYGSYLRSKTPAALKDLRQDGAFRICHWFIDEILAERAKQ